MVLQSVQKQWRSVGEKTVGGQILRLENGNQRLWNSWLYIFFHWARHRDTCIYALCIYAFIVNFLQDQLHVHPCRALLGPWPPPGPPCVPEGGGWGTGPRGGPPRPPPIAAPLSPNKFVNSLKLDTKNHIGTYMYIHFPWIVSKFTGWVYAVMHRVMQRVLKMT